MTRTFLPWYRLGYAAALQAPPPAGAARAPVPATVTLRDAGRVDVPIELAGPGDVVGLDPREILRTEPFDGCADFEPSYFPYVELASPDLPWRFTPEGPRTAALPQPPGGPGSGTQQRVAPWIALVVVPAEAATLTPAAAGGLAVLRCDADELPDAGEAWAWAHVQVSHDATQSLSDALATPGSAVARLLCPRRLDAGIEYLACLIPTFAAGRSALLAGGAGGNPLGPAWSGSGPVELPVYHHWSFRTGDDGSFEAVVRRLRPRPIPAGTGGRDLAIGAPGWGATAAAATATVRMQGALRPVGVTEPDAGDQVLAESLRAVVSTSGAGLELRPPLYGQDYQHGVTAIAAHASGWLAELNTDPRRRVAAGLGSIVVAVRQEDLADSAWKQLAAQGADTRQQVDPALADAVLGSLADRHPALAPAAPAMSRLLRAGGPFAVGAPSAPADTAPASVVTLAAPAGDGPGPTGGFAPRFDEAGYALLRSVAPEWLLPELSELPTDTVALAQTNGAFVESFMVGLNHALARELTWRRFPVRSDGTFFDQFWSGAELPPIVAWNATDPLGSHGGPDDRLVLLVRGALLRRFPTAQIFLSAPAPPGGATEQRLRPAFSGRIGLDCAFFGFPLTAEQALADGANWSVVVQEALDHARFGVDDPPVGGGTTPLNSWQDLDWVHPHLAGHTHVPVAGPLSGVSRPAAHASPTSAVWGLDAANLAVAVLQPAFQVRIPVALWLRVPQTTSP
jgi:hypothetical protein